MKSIQPKTTPKSVAGRELANMDSDKRAEVSHAFVSCVLLSSPKMLTLTPMMHPQLPLLVIIMFLLRSVVS